MSSYLVVIDKDIDSEDLAILIDKKLAITNVEVSKINDDIPEDPTYIKPIIHEPEYDETKEIIKQEMIEELKKWVVETKSILYNTEDPMKYMFYYGLIRGLVESIKLLEEQ